MEFSIPFEIACGGPEIENCQIADIETEIEYLETRMLNPRKLLTRCGLIIRVTGYRKKNLIYYSGAAADESWHVEQRLEKRRAILLTRAAEREFNFSDNLILSPGRPGATELLSARVTPSVNETRMIGNKLIFKGIFNINLLYRTEDGDCDSCTGELPFSQIMDIDRRIETPPDTDADISASLNAKSANINGNINAKNAGENNINNNIKSESPENAWASVRVDLTGWDIQIDGADPDGRQIAVTLYLYAMAVLREERELILLTDLYSTAYDLKYQSAPLEIVRSYDKITRRQTVRELLEIGVVVDSILLLRVDCGPVTTERDGDAVILRTSATIRALYRDEGGAALIAERRIETGCRLEASPDCMIKARAICSEEPHGSVGERGIEIRFPVDFQIESVILSQENGVTAAELNPDAPTDAINAPSLVLRGLEPGETLWDLAKAYNSTIEEIQAANNLNNNNLNNNLNQENAETPRLLLIPRKRA